MSYFQVDECPRGWIVPCEMSYHREPSPCMSCGEGRKEEPRSKPKCDCVDCRPKKDSKKESKKDKKDKDCDCRDCREKKHRECEKEECDEHRPPRCPSPQKQHKNKQCRACPKPREDCEEITTVRVGIFSGSQPAADVLDLSGCPRAVGFDVELAWEIYHNRLGYCVEFYEVPVRNVGLNQLLCGLVDVVASSTVNITDARRLLANYIVTDNPDPLQLAAILPASLNIACGPNTLRDLWLAVGGPAGLNGCPTQTNFAIARNSIGTVQSNTLRDALSAAYPNCATLDAYFLQQTVDVRQFSCAEIVAGFNTLYQAAVIGPRGDVVQLQVIFDAVDALFPGQFILCPNVATIPAIARGWAIRSCKLAFETQHALDAIVADGTYDNLVQQAASFPLFDQECLLAGAGETFLIRPPHALLSVTSGFIDSACVACLCKLCLREVKCACDKPVVRPHDLTGRIVCDVPFDCCECECETVECCRRC